MDKKVILLIGAWNFRSLKEVFKLKNFKREIDRLKLDIAGVSEVKWGILCQEITGKLILREIKDRQV